MTNFPGNPYGGPTGRRISYDSAAITQAIKLLAFEVRTATLQRQTELVASGADFTDTPPGVYELWHSLASEVSSRLGIPEEQVSPPVRTEDYSTPADIVNGTGR